MRSIRKSLSSGSCNHTFFSKHHILTPARANFTPSHLHAPEALFTQSAERACAMRRATSDTAFKMLCRDRRMDREARLGVNQGEAEGVYDCTRPSWHPKICPQDCPRGAAADLKKVELDRRMHRGARLGVNQGDNEGVYDCTRLSWHP